MNNLLASFIGIGLVLVVVIFISLFFIKFGWSLFMVPVFNMPELTWMQALGLSFLASAFKPTSYKSKD